MRYCWIALIALMALTAGAQQSTLGRLSTGAFGTNTTVLYPESGDPSTIITTNPAAGKNYLFGPGTYYLSNWCSIPTNGSIRGSGRGTVFVNMFTNSGNLPFPVIAQTDGSYISDLVISNFYRGGGATAIYQACLGFHTNVQPPFNGGVAERVLMYGGTDGYYVRGSNAAKGALISCVITSSWDCSVFLGAAHQFELWDCTLTTLSPVYNASSKESLIGFDSSTGAYVRAVNCRFYGANTHSRVVDDGSGGGITVEIAGGTITNTFSVDFSIQNTSSKLYLSPSIVGFDATKLSENLNHAQSVFYRTLTTTNITFGGTADDGLGPKLSSQFPTTKSINSDSALNMGGNPLTNVSFLIIASNTPANKPALAAGNAMAWSSNGVPFLEVADQNATKSTNIFGAFMRATVSGSDATTTGQALADIAGLSIALSTNAVYEFEAVMSVSTSAVTTGTKYGVQYSVAGATIEAQIVASLTTTASASERITALNTATANAYLTTSAQSGQVLIKGVITTGANSGNLTIQHLKVTSGTSTVFQKSFLKAIRIS